MGLKSFSLWPVRAVTSLEVEVEARVTAEEITSSIHLIFCRQAFE